MAAANLLVAHVFKEQQEAHFSNCKPYVVVDHFRLHGKSHVAWERGCTISTLIDNVVLYYLWYADCEALLLPSCDRYQAVPRNRC